VYRVLFLGVKRSGRVLYNPPHLAPRKERVELYHYSTSGPSWPVLGWSLPLHLPLLDTNWCPLDDRGIVVRLPLKVRRYSYLFLNLQAEPGKRPPSYLLSTVISSPADSILFSAEFKNAGI